MWRRLRGTLHERGWSALYVLASRWQLNIATKLFERYYFVQKLQETIIMSLDEDIAKLLNENISLQDSKCLAEVLGDYFASSDDGK